MHQNPDVKIAQTPQMNRIRLRYFEQEDVLHLLVSDKLEKSSIELSPNITVELNDNNEVVGVEILKATGFLLKQYPITRMP